MLGQENRNCSYAFKVINQKKGHFIFEAAFSKNEVVNYCFA